MNKKWFIKIGWIFVIVVSFSLAGCTNHGELPVTKDPDQMNEEIYSEEGTEATLEGSQAEKVTSSEDETWIDQTADVTTEVEETTKEDITTGGASSVETTEVESEFQDEEETMIPVTQEVTTVPFIEEPTTHDAPTEGTTTEAPSTEAPTTEAPVPQSISVKVKGDHYIGDSLGAGDFTVMVTMSDGTTKKNPAGWSADQLFLGSYETVITVTYEGVSSTVTVYATERPTEAPTEAPIEAPTEAPETPPVEVPVGPQLSFDRTGAEAAWNIQKGIIESQAFNLTTMDYTGYPIQWSERLYQLACRRAQEIVDNFSHDGFHSIDASAENIAKNVPYADMVIDGWYNSAGHKKNMLGGWDYGAIAKYGNYWVALFSNTP